MLEMSGECTVTKWSAAGNVETCSNERGRKSLKQQVKHKQEIKDLKELDKYLTKDAKAAGKEFLSISNPKKALEGNLGSADL